VAMLPWLGASLPTVFAVPPYHVAGQSKQAVGAAVSPAPAPRAVQAAHAGSATSVIVLGKDSLRLPPLDSLARTDLWLGYSYSIVGRRKDAESAYLRILPKVSETVRTYVRAQLQTIWEEDEASAFRWVPWPFRPILAWFSEWQWRAEALWLVAVAVLAYLRYRTTRAGKTQLRIQPFTRNLPPDIGVGIEETVADFHRKTNEVSAPVGILINSGLKLPVMSTARPEELVELVEIVSPEPWIPKVLALILKGAYHPRYVVSGHASGTLSSVRIVAGLDDEGRRVHAWDRTVRSQDLIESERALACEIVYALSEYSS
jgi:hypothetical protein